MINYNNFIKCQNIETLKIIYPLLTRLDQLYLESIEDRRHIKSYKLFKNCIFLQYNSGATFKQFYEKKSLDNIINYYAKAGNTNDR